MESEPFPVYWMEERRGKKTIHSTLAVEVTEHRVIFEDKNWNPITSCFLTEHQCRTFHGMPPQARVDWKAKAIAELEELATKWRGY